MNYNTGDTVKIFDVCEKNAKFYGRTGIVLTIVDDLYAYYVSFSDDLGDSQFFRVDQLELVKKREEVELNGFKEGDEVRIECDGYTTFGKITFVDPYSRYPYCVETVETNWYQVCDLNTIECVHCK